MSDTKLISAADLNVDDHGLTLEDLDACEGIADFDIAEHLASDAATAAYLNDILNETEDPGLLAAALGDIARAKGMTQIANDTGIAREALYKALRAGSSPRLDTIRRVLQSIGLQLTIQSSFGKAAGQPEKDRQFYHFAYHAGPVQHNAGMIINYVDAGIKGALINPNPAPGLAQKIKAPKSRCPARKGELTILAVEEGQVVEKTIKSKPLARRKPANTVRKHLKHS